MNVTGFTQLFASIGATNHGNPGPAAYNLALEAMEFDGVYVALESQGTAAEVVSSIRTLGLNGSTITKPFKQDVIPYLDEIDEKAQAIGAVNVIASRNGRLVGYNSDGPGAVNALREVIDPSGKSIALLGAGGAARAIALHCKEAQSHVHVFNRTEETARQLCDDLGVSYGGSLEDVEGFDVIINATSLGMVGQEATVPLPETAFANHPVVFDIVTKPRRTSLMDYAESLGCVVVPGVSMTAHQAVFALEWITGNTPSLEILKAGLGQSDTPS